MTKKTTLTKSFIASLAIAASLSIVSCSHEQSKTAGWDGIRDGASAEQSSDPSSSEGIASAGDTAAKEDTASAPTDASSPDLSQAAASTTTPSSPDDKKAEVSENLDAGTSGSVAGLMPESPSEKATPDKKNDLSVPQASPETSPEASKDVAAAAETTPPTDNTAAASAAVASKDSPDPSTSTDSPDPSNSDKSSADISSTTPAPAKKSVAVSHLPEIPTEAIAMGGQVLNRYYFVRKGDTAESVAAKIFGSSQASEDLVKWNGGKANWQPGQVIKYASPQNHNDSKMISFWAERNATATTYQVKAGDVLSKIAKEQYGDVRSWKEIAITNAMTSPDGLKVGMTLNLFSSDAIAPAADDKMGAAQPTTHEKAEISADSQITHAATKAEAVVKPKAEIDGKPAATVPAAAPQQDAKANELFPVQSQPQSQNVEQQKAAPTAKTPVVEVVDREPLGNVSDLPLPGQVTPVAAAPQQAKQGGAIHASMEIVRFVGQNFFMVALGLGAFGFLFFMMLLRRRRSQMDSDF